MARWLLLLGLSAPLAHADSHDTDTDTDPVTDTDADTDAEEWVEGEPAAHLAGEAGGASGCDVLGAGSVVLAAVGAALTLARRRG